MSAAATASLVEDGVRRSPGRVPVLGAAEAVRVATGLAAELAAGAAERDAERVLPGAELEALSASGLLAVTVPAAYGGADLSAETLAEVFRILAAGDPSLAQIPHSHFVYVNALRHQGTPDQQRFFFGEVLAGRRFGNAQSEVGTKHVRDIRTTLTPSGRGWLLNGEKGYCTGALFADWIPVLAHLDTDGPLHVAWVERSAPGVTVVDDWDGLGQRTTASGTVRLEDVDVADARITPYHLTFEGPQTYGAFAQLLHAALDAGIARAAITEAAEFVTTKSRPYPDAGVDAGRRRPAGRARLRRDGAPGAGRRGAAPRGRPGRRPGRRRPHRGDRGARRASRSPRPGRRARRPPSRSPAASSRWPAPARRWPASTSTGTGATPAPTPCTTRRRGRSSTWAATPWTGPCRPTTGSSEKGHHDLPPEVPLVPAHQRR